jgi:DNA-binding phage protein
MRDEKIAERFAENLRHQIAESFNTEDEIATRAELHSTELTRLLEGKRVPMLDTVVKLAGALGIPLTDLLDGME